MRLLLTALLSFLSVAFAEVLEIKGKDKFNEIVKKNEFVVAAFTAPWCGHCKRLKPEYEKASESLKEDSIVLLNIDATDDANKGLAQKYKVQGYPTLYIFRNNNAEKPLEYEGPRDEKGIVSYLKRMSGPASSLKTDKASVKELTESEAAVIGVFPGGEKSADFKAFMEAAGALRNDVDLYHVFDASLLGDHCKKDCKSARIFVFKQFDTPVMSLDAKGAKKAKIEEWISNALTPEVIELSNAPRYKKAVGKIFEDRETPKVLVFAPADEKDAYRAAVAEAQKTTDLQYLLVVGSDNQGALNFFGLSKDDLPAFAIHQLTPEAKFVEKNTEAKALVAFIKKYKDGKVEKHIKSEPVPEDNSGPVKVVVAKNWEEIVTKSGKDVLLEAYAPWCGHCKKLAPIYDAVGEHYADDDEIVIAKIDATANDILEPRMDVRGFPTIYFYKHATDEVIKYEGDRTEQSFYDFIAKNRSNPKDETEEEEAEEEEEEPKKDEL